MIDNLFKKLHIRMKPDKLATYLLYLITIILVLFSLSRVLGFMIGSARIQNNISPYLYTLFIFAPVLAFSFFVNSGLAKSDIRKINMFIASCSMLGIIVGSMTCTWLSNAFWWIVQQIPGYEEVMRLFPEFFSPAIKTLCLAVPFVAVFRIIDYFLLIFRDEDLPKAIAGFNGMSLSTTVKEVGAFTCETAICKAKGTSLPVIVPEKKRYESTLVQGATGTGKTSMVLLPMSALDLEKKFFFREFSKKIGYSMLKSGVAYMNGPFNNEFVNQNFSLTYLRPRRGREEEFMNNVKPIVQYIDNSNGQISYKNLGITIIENDGKFISDFTGVAKNFEIDILAIDPASPETTLSINPFAIPDPAKVASIVADVLNAMYESTGGGKAGDPFFTQVTIDAFQNLSILLKEMYPILHDGEVASLEDMLELLYNFDAVEEMTEEMKKIPELEQKYKLLIKYFEKNFYKPALNINGFEIPGTRGSGRKDTEKFLYGAITQLNNLVRHPGLKAALCGKDNIIDFDKALDSGSVITACSRKGELGLLQAKAFGMFFILQFQDAVLRRKGIEDSRTPHFLYIDEFPEYITKDMEVMFTLFRKYRCGVTVAIQNLSQLEKSGKDYYRQVVLANTKTQIVFGDTVPEDSHYWDEAFGIEKRADQSSSFKIDSDGNLNKSTNLEVKKKNRAEWYKIANLGFGAVYYKTKDSKGKTVFGQGKTEFLNSKYKEKAYVQKFNFEKYMMSKPDNPTITIDDSDNTTNDDNLFGVNTSSRLKEEIERLSNESVLTGTSTIQRKETKSNVNNNIENAVISSDTDTSIPDDFEIIFDDNEPTLDNAGINGGAITEDYETPAIKESKK
ncbi:MAG: TraM recognition domain-containing protein [Clostridia bacterium]|nr:TraM recognition domain-containing protein [Clostridia bacterium]